MNRLRDIGRAANCQVDRRNRRIYVIKVTERSHIPGEIANSRRSGVKTLLTSSGKTHYQNMDTILEAKEEDTTPKDLSEHRHWKLENSIATKKVERRSEHQKSRTSGGDYSSEEGERGGPSNKQYSAHEIYRRTGDWWNVFPKTDYTYSENSQCRYEIAPGVLAMPNMSRRSIHSESGNSTSLYPLKVMGSWKRGTASSADSDRELDEEVSVSSKSKGKRKLTQQLMSSATIIVLWFSTILKFLKLKTVRRREYHASDECERRESKWYNMWHHADRYLTHIYLFMVKALLFDSWLLSRMSNIRRWIQPQKSPKMLWIALLPLLILTGTYIVKKQSVIHLDSLHNVSYDIAETIYRSKNNNRMLLLEKSLEEQDLVNTYAHEIETIKLQFRALKELYSDFKSCCYTHSKAVSNEDLEKRIEMILVDYFGTPLPKKDLVNVIRNLAAAGEEKDSPILPDKVSTSSSTLTDNRVREIVREALKVYDADKTGRVDYALESAGGQIISTRCTQRYDIKTRVFKLLAFTLFHENNNPRTVIQGNPIQPGACWAFQGFPGYLLIKLRSFIYVTGFTVEHAPKSILPYGEMTSAPRKFNVWGFVDENDPVPVMFGDYEFAASEESLQYFLDQNSAIVTPYEYIELRVHSNHGQLDYTCLYRFRVHGRPA